MLKFLSTNLILQIYSILMDNTNLNGNICLNIFKIYGVLLDNITTEATFSNLSQNSDKDKLKPTIISEFP